MSNETFYGAMRTRQALAIVTSFVHSSVLQHLLYEHYAKYLAKCRPVRFAKEKYQSCPKVIIDFCGRFEFDFPLV